MTKVAVILVFLTVGAVVASALCGDRLLDAGEQCDSGEFCTPNCTCVAGFVPTVPRSINCTKNTTLCGNGRIDPGEQCERGGAFCSSNCTCLPGSFPSSPVSSNCTNRTTCGNGVLDIGEECEVGGRNCNSNCKCVNGSSPSSPVNVNCTLRPICGNGVLEAFEQCEVGGLFCNNNCTCAVGHLPTVPVSVNCASIATGCGNGVLEAGEECEVSGSNCSPSCSCSSGTVSTIPLSHHCVQPQYQNASLFVPCTNNSSHYTCIPGISSQFLACHNGFLSFENCLPGLFCDPSFVVAPNFTFFNPCSVALTPVCGNGLVEPGEQCEIGGANCTSQCKCSSGTVPSSPTSRSCITSKPTSVCGNGKIENGEECEIGGNGCSSTCKCEGNLFQTSPKSIHCVSGNYTNLNQICSTINQTAFTCLPGITGQYLRCGSDSPTFFDCPAATFCAPTSLFTLSSPCVIPRFQSICGNQVLEPGEQCDFGENCDSTCSCLPGTSPTFPEGIHCAPQSAPSLVEQCRASSGLKCEQGISRFFLVCAEPLTVSLNACPLGTVCSSANTTAVNPCGTTNLEGTSLSTPNLLRSINQPRRKVLAAICGDNTVESGEECDGGSGCSALCKCLPGYAPTGFQSCSRLEYTSLCGNTILESGEECEAGGSYCGTDCKCLPNSQPTIPTSVNCAPVGRTDSQIWCAGTSGLRCVPGIFGQYLECAFPFFTGFRPCAPGTQCLLPGFSPFNPCILPPQGPIITPVPLPPIPIPPTVCGTSLAECQLGGQFCDSNCYCLPGSQPQYPRRRDCSLIAPSTCGNGNSDPGEACDGGNLCENCVCISGGVPTLPPTRSCSLCRNGILNSGEQCDSGSLCNQDCTCASGSVRTSPPSTSCTRCGNNILDLFEQCDGGFGCTECSCRNGFATTLPPSTSCRQIPTCGNAILDPGEACDSGRGCLSNCVCGPGFVPVSPPQTFCVPQDVCGDGIVTSGEQCDGGLGCFACQCAAGFAPFFPAQRDCRPVVICGDGIVQSPEQCDGGIGCSSSCNCQPGFQTASPPRQFCLRLCGNSIVDPGEECDGGLGCKSDCTCDLTGNFRPFSPPQPSCFATCGNGIIDAGEQCDSGVGCDSNCRCISGTPQRVGFQPYSPPQTACKPNCGDNRIEPPEQCDGGFGCDANCDCRPGFRSTGSILCIPQLCGNGRIDFGEECEVGGAGCRAWCQCDLGYAPFSPVRADCLRL